MLRMLLGSSVTLPAMASRSFSPAGDPSSTANVLFLPKTTLPTTLFAPTLRPGDMTPPARLVMDALTVPLPLIVPALRTNRALVSPPSSATSSTPLLRVMKPELMGRAPPFHAPDVRLSRAVLLFPMNNVLPGRLLNGLENELEVLIIKRPLALRSMVPRLYRP